MPAKSQSMQQLNDLVSTLDAAADHSTDLFTLVESRLFERRLASV